MRRHRVQKRTEILPMNKLITLAALLSLGLVAACGGVETDDGLEENEAAWCANYPLPCDGDDGDDGEPPPPQVTVTGRAYGEPVSIGINGQSVKDCPAGVSCSQNVTVGSNVFVMSIRYGTSVPA